MKWNNLWALGLLGLAVAAPVARGGTFTANFNDGLVPAGAVVFGNGTSAGVVELNGGVGDSGALKLTKAVNGIQGGLILPDLDAGATVNGFEANFKVRIGGGTATPADGMSFCFASDLPDGGFGEGGAGSGLRIIFDIYNNTTEAPSFRVDWNGAQVYTSGQLTIADLTTAGNYVDVLVRINPTGTLDFTFGSRVLANKLNIGFQPITGGRFGWGGRTGGLNANQFVDDVSITTTVGTFLQPGVVRAPLSARIIAGYSAPMNVIVNDPAGSTLQWERAAPGSATFTPVAGATAASYQSPVLTLADSGVQYRVVVTNGGGTSVTSNPAIFEVVTLPHATPNTVSYNFNDGLVPAGTGVFGTAEIVDGHLSLTEAANDEAGTWIVNDLNAGGPVGSIDLAFKILLSPDEGAAPADGFGFHWAPDLPEIGFTNAEEPVGTGLSIGFDVYNNGNAEAPAVDVFWLGTRIGGIAVPGELLDTQETFVDVQIRLSAAGLVDVSINGVVLVYQLQIPNWTAFSGARYGFAARTGGLNQRQWLDDVQIRSTAYAGPIGVVSQPVNAVALPGRTASFSVTSNDPSRTTYQWQLSAGGGAFTNIAGATSATYTTPALTAGDEGNQYRAVITSSFNGSTATTNAATLNVYNLTGPVSPQILDRFNDLATVDNGGSVPAAVQTLSGNFAFVDGATGGFLRLTEQVNSQFGTLVIDDFNTGAAVGGFTASMKVQVTGPNPADGWSFSWGTGITPIQVYGGLESGIGNDLRVGFITYGPSGRSIRVTWRGVQVARTDVPIELLQTATDAFEDVLIRVTPANGANPATIDVAQDGFLAIRSVALPGLTGLAGANFAIAARTGGANELHAYDDLAISTSLYVGPISLASQPPASLTVLSGLPATLTVVSSNPPVTTYQWQRAAPGSADFVNVGTNSSLTTPVLTTADSGATYRVIATGPSNQVTSTPTVIQVVDAGLPATWERTIDFNDQAIPADAASYGTAVVNPTSGRNASAALELTPAANDSQGALVLPAVGGGGSVQGFVTRFYMQIGTLAAGNATNPPADGASFVWAPEEITGAFGEGGAGTGLVISFDVYDNGGGEAPAIEAFWKGETLGNILVPRELMESGVDYREVIVRVNPTGTLDVIYANQVIFWHMPLPNFAPIENSTIGWGGRTGGLNAQQSLDDIQLNLFLDQEGISVSLTGANVVITFDGILESSPDLVNWTALPAQTSPLIIPKATITTKMYYRSRP